MVATSGAEAQRRGEQTRLADSNGGDRSGIVTFRTHRRRRAGENLWVGERDAGRQEVQGGESRARSAARRHRRRYIVRRGDETRASPGLRSGPNRFHL